MISIIVAIDKNNAIGRKNALLWHIAEDLKYFKTKTSGHPVIMGDKTFESIGKALPKRRNIIVTLLKEYKAPDGVEVYDDLGKLLTEIQQEKGTAEEQEYFVIGGASVYKFAFDYADKLYITQIDAIASEPDAFFPKIEPQVWDLTSVSEPHYDEENKLYFRFLQYLRKSQSRDSKNHKR